MLELIQRTDSYHTLKTREEDGKLLTKKDLRNYIVSELATDIRIKNLSDDDSLLESGIIDSMAVVQLMTFIEEKYMIKISDEELVPENFETINTLWVLIQDKLR